MASYIGMFDLPPSCEEDLGSQIRKDGTRIILTLRQVHQAEQVSVTKKVREDEDLSHKELHISW